MQSPHKQFKQELKEYGFAIYSKKKDRIPNYYPEPFPIYKEYEDYKIEDISEGDFFNVRAFFPYKHAGMELIDSGILLIEIELIEDDLIMGYIHTKTPKVYNIQQGASISLTVDELLEKVEIKE